LIKSRRTQEQEVMLRAKEKAVKILKKPLGRKEGG